MGIAGIRMFLFSKMATKKIPRQSLKRFTFRVKLSDSIFFFLGLSPIENLFDRKSKSF